jgi:DNA-binding HxlR family transcriptional regulator
MSKRLGCPVQATSKALAGKWKVPIVWHLAYSSRRFGELRLLLPGVSDKVLAAQLRDLESDGIVKRASAKTIPPRVDYMLQAAGKELIPVMQAMCDWGAKHFGIEPNLPRPSETVPAP